MIKDLLGTESKINRADNRTGEVWKSKADISKARKLLAFKPEVGFEEGMKRTVEWYRNTHKKDKL